MRPSRLRTRFLRLSAVVTSLTVLVFMAGTLIHLRYGMEQTIDEQLENLAPDILAQVSQQESAFTGDELPVLFTLFDENNLIRLLRLENRSGQEIYANPHHEALLAKDEEERSRDRLGKREALQTLWHEGRSWRMARFEDERHRIVLAADLARMDQSLWQVLIAFVFALPLAVAGAAIASVVLARQASDPIEQLTARARSVTASQLDARLDLGPAPLEVKALGEIFNRMMDRLQRSFEQARRFSADASHELKSPLTVMQGLLENRLSEEGSEGINREEAVQLLEETLRMRAIVEGLLVLAKADEGSLIRHREIVNMNELIGELCEDAAVMAEAGSARFEARTDPLLPVHGDPPLLRMALMNLVSNAVKYCPAGGVVRLSSASGGAGIEVDVFNSGAGIPEEAQTRIFDRFYRVGSGRSRLEAGLGLGLNIAREVARAHGGDVILLRTDAAGTAFRFELPSPRDFGRPAR